jgi:molecular chaperone HscB
MRLDSDDFELFGVPRRFTQDGAAIDARWRALQSEVHPDRFASDGAAAQRVAMQWAVRVNEAYRRLKDPVARAAQLCELAGVPIDAARNTAMPQEFLAQQMAWREALDDADGTAAVLGLATQVAGERRGALARIERALDCDGDARAAAREVRSLMFIERFAQDVDARLEALET